MRRAAGAAGALRRAWNEKGWRRSTLMFSIAAAVAFLANLGFTVWAITRGVTNGVGVIAEKECVEIRKLNAGVHVLVNALSTLLLAGSNYCMQLLSSPTRSLIDNAHKSRRWMDIGVSSVRNIFDSGNCAKRRLLWLLLGLSSLPLHLFYNSAIFQSISVNSYNVWQMNKEWAETGNTSTLSFYTLIGKDEALASLHAAIVDGRLERLNVTACVEAYATPFQSTRSDLVLVADGGEPGFGLVKDHDSVMLKMDRDDLCGTTQSFQWMCGQQRPRVPDESRNETCPALCVDSSSVLIPAGKWKPFNKTVEYCYSLPSQEHCKLQFSAGLLVTVVILNLAKAVLMLACALGWRDEPPLLTVGDAVASFLERPDASTEGMCLLTRGFVHLDWTKSPEKPAETFGGRRRRTSKAASRRKWNLTLILLIFAILLCLTLLTYGISKLKGRTGATTIMALGLGAVDAQTLMVTAAGGGHDGAGAGDLLLNVVMANTPQLAFSLVYFSYNGLFTTMALAREWGGFALARKGLRRSGGALRGAQRSAYFLQLPWRYTLVLLPVSGALHWLISQSIFLVYVEQYVADAAYSTTVHRPYSGRAAMDIITCGWSPPAVVASVAVGAVMVVYLLAFGFRRLPSGMPIVGSCSAAIAAACHPLASKDDGRPWEEPLQWGVTREPAGEEPGHCSFSSGPVSYPVTSRRYL